MISLSDASELSARGNGAGLRRGISPLSEQPGRPLRHTATSRPKISVGCLEELIHCLPWQELVSAPLFFELVMQAGLQLSDLVLVERQVGNLVRSLALAADQVEEVVVVFVAMRALEPQSPLLQ